MSTIKAKQFHLIEDMDIAALTFAPTLLAGVLWIRNRVSSVTSPTG